MFADPLLFYEFNNGKGRKLPVTIYLFRCYIYLIGISKAIVFCLSFQAEGGYDFSPYLVRKVDGCIMEIEARVGELFFHHEDVITDIFCGELSIDMKRYNLDFAWIAAQSCS